MPNWVQVPIGLIIFGEVFERRPLSLSHEERRHLPNPSVSLVGTRHKERTFNRNRQTISTIARVDS